MTRGNDDLASLLRAARKDENVLGVVIGGSRGKGAHVTDASDWDVYLVVRERPEGVRSERGGAVEVMHRTLDDLRDEPDWNRYTFAHVRPALDKTGEVARVVAELARRDPAAAGERLDAYLNSYYRSLKNSRLGLDLASRLDAAESVPWWLEFLFTAHGRVRPYNKWLRWELETHPLAEPWSADALLPLLERIVATGAVDGQRALFRLTETFARERGLGDVIDGWEPDVALFRG